MGKICSIYVASGPGTPMTAVPSAIFVAKQGLTGDRYSTAGSFSAHHDKHGIVDDATIYGWDDLQKINALLQEDAGAYLRRNLIVTMPMRAFVVSGLAKITTKDGLVMLQWSANCAPCTRPGKLGNFDPAQLHAAMYEFGFGGERAAIVQVEGSGLVTRGDTIEVYEEKLPSFSRRR